MDLETYHMIHGWPEIPTDPDEVLAMTTQGELVLDQDLLLYLWARSEAGA
jgi:hypothetical protein